MGGRPGQGRRAAAGAGFALAFAALFLLGGFPVAGGPGPAVAPAALRGACHPCSPVPEVSRSASAAIGWQNVTPEQLGALPPAAYGSSMAFDPIDHELVWFGGCGRVVCPSAYTWVYANERWTNLTGNTTRTPPGGYGAMMSYDPNAGAVVLTGGAVTTAGTTAPTNATWEFAAGHWVRTSLTCDNTTSLLRACRYPLAWSSFGFDADPAVHRSVLFGGCGSPTCLGPGGIPLFQNATYWFNGSTGNWSYRTPTSGPNPSARAGAAMAYDPVAGGLVLFGGEGACGFAVCALNDTWLYAGGHWTNVTNVFAPSNGSLPTRAFASMTWDPELGELVLMGGNQSPSNGFPNTTQALVCTGPAACHWSAPAIALAPQIAGAAMASNSSSLVPLLVGGVCTLACAPTNATWIYGALSNLNVAVAPAPQEVRQPVYLTATSVGWANPTFTFLWGDKNRSQSTTGNGQHVFPAYGVYNATLVVVHPNATTNIHTLQLFVHPGPAAQILASLPQVDVGVVDHFLAVPVLGTGSLPFNFSWKFGSGPTLYGTAVTHAFASPGNATVVANVTDALRLPGTARLVVPVAAYPAVSLRGQYSVGGVPLADAGIPTSLFAVVTGGTGPFNYSWQFGDGTRAYGIAPSHTFPGGSTAPVVSIVVTDSGGGAAFVNQSVHVTPAFRLDALSASPSSPTVGASVTFTSTPSGGDGTDSIQWTFGDGSAPSNGATVTHTYRATGAYRVTAWANDSAGSSSSQTLNVTVASLGGAVLGVLLEPPVLGAILLGIAAVAYVLVVRRRRRARAPPEDATDA